VRLLSHGPGQAVGFDAYIDSSRYFQGLEINDCNVVVGRGGYEEVAQADGVRPYSRRKAAVKWLWLEYPSVSATSVRSRRRIGTSSSAAARRSRLR